MNPAYFSHPSTLLKTILKSRLQNWKNPFDAGTSNTVYSCWYVHPILWWKQFPFICISITRKDFVKWKGNFLMMMQTRKKEEKNQFPLKYIFQKLLFNFFVGEQATKIFREDDMITYAEMSLALKLLSSTVKNWYTVNNDKR